MIDGIDINRMGMSEEELQGKGFCCLLTHNLEDGEEKREIVIVNSIEQNLVKYGLSHECIHDVLDDMVGHEISKKYDNLIKKILNSDRSATEKWNIWKRL